jgi:glycerol dehydrogenase-like iron-containing ADH family enzyme
MILISENHMTDKYTSTTVKKNNAVVVCSQSVAPKVLLLSSNSQRALAQSLPHIDVVATEIVGGTAPAGCEAEHRLDGVEAVAGLGGGTVMDAAKLRGLRLGLPVICIPTVLSTDACFTDSAAVRRDGAVHYVPTGAPAQVVIDEPLLLRAPAAMNALGCCDVFSILTASEDWRRDHGASSEALRAGRQICETLLRAEDDIAAGTQAGLKAVLEALVAEVQLCRTYGSDRLEEGSEHYLAYALEARAPGHLHGALVGLGILFALRLQGRDIGRLVRFMNATGIARACLEVPRAAIVETLALMPAFVRDGAYPPSVWDAVALTRAEAEELCRDVLSELRP